MMLALLLACTPPETDPPVTETHDSVVPDSEQDSSPDSPVDSEPDSSCEPVEISATLGLEIPTVLDVLATAPTELTVSFEDTSFTVAMDLEKTLWGLPPETDVELQPACGEAFTVRTGSLSPEEALPLGVTLSTRTENSIRFLMPIRRDDGSNALVMLDELGRTVWRQEMPTNAAYLKGLAVAPSGQRAYLFEDSFNIGNFPSLFEVAPDGSMETHELGLILHHDIAIGPDGEFYGLGWDLRSHEGYEVLADTIYRFDLEGNTEELWNAWDVLEPPNAEWLEERVGKTGLYRGDVVLWTYVNSVTHDWPSGNVVGTNGAAQLGPIVLPEGWLFSQNNTEQPAEMAELALGQIFEQMHSAWMDDQDRLLIYNRRQGPTGASVDTWSLDRDAEKLDFIGLYRPEDDDGYIPNTTVGGAFPVDNRVGDVDLVVSSYPNPRRTIELISGAWEGENQEVVLRLAPPDSSDHEHFVGYVEAYSLGFLNQ